MSDVTLTPIGPWSDADGRWCCGLNCGTPCPYELKLKPKAAALEARHPGST